MYVFSLYVSYWYWWFYFMLSYIFPCGRNWCAPCPSEVHILSRIFLPMSSVMKTSLKLHSDMVTECSFLTPHWYVTIIYWNSTILDWPSLLIVSWRTPFRIQGRCLLWPHWYHHSNHIHTYQTFLCAARVISRPDGNLTRQLYVKRQSMATVRLSC